LHYGLIAFVSMLLLSACRSAPTPAATPATAPRESRESRVAASEEPEEPRDAAAADTTVAKARPRTPERVASRPAAKRPATARKPAPKAASNAGSKPPSKPASKPPSKPAALPLEEKASADDHPVTVAGAPATPSATRPGVIRAPLPPRLGGTPAGQRGDATAVARSPKDTTAVVSEHEVTRRAVEVFGDSMTAPPPVVPDSAPEPEAESESESEEVPRWDIDVASYETHARVERYVRMFSGPVRDRFVKQLEAGSRYEPMIRAKFRAGGLPEDMYYLALVESGYNPHAYSRASAVGMWQFMVSTGRGMGLRIDWWVDERRDPVRSTGAAVRFLRGLRAQFGSLYLAAAAYNGGPGRVARGLSRYRGELEGATGDDRFFALAETKYLRRETREYVPQLIAAALIAKDPARYGLKIYSLPPFRYDSVRVGPQTPLAAVAMAAGTSVATIQELNPHLLRGMTPPGKPYLIRVPYGTSVDFDSAFAALEPAHRLAVNRVVVKKNESLTTIARRAGITVRQLSWYNPNLARSRNPRAVPGTVLLVPTPATAAAARSVPDPLIERRYRGSGRSRVHVVNSGETLGHIAKRYGTSTNTLMRMNRLKRPVIFPGQALVVPGRR
jgi:membrane-bound lytic murein transglycosylase D